MKSQTALFLMGREHKAARSTVKAEVRQFSYELLDLLGKIAQAKSYCQLANGDNILGHIASAKQMYQKALEVLHDARIAAEENPLAVTLADVVENELLAVQKRLAPLLPNTTVATFYLQNTQIFWKP